MDLRNRVISQFHKVMVITCIKKLTWTTAYFNSSCLAELPKVIFHGILFTYVVLKVHMSSLRKINKVPGCTSVFPGTMSMANYFFFLCKLIGLNIQTL